MNRRGSRAPPHVHARAFAPHHNALVAVALADDGDRRTFRDLVLPCDRPITSMHSFAGLVSMR